MKVRVFLSWSGDRSRTLATELKKWIPRVIQSVDPWLSSSNIAKGDRWSEQVGKKLATSRLGIVCVTPENVSSRWLNFEAGAISKALGESKVCPILLGMRPADLDGPLSQFQATVCSRDDILALINSLNAELRDEGVDSMILEETFHRLWPSLESAIDSLSKLPISPTASNMPAAIRTFAKYGLPEPDLGGSAYFSEGFESHVLYNSVCSIAKDRLYVFGRKNRKLFDKDHEDFFRDLASRVSNGFDFRCLFLGSDAPEYVLQSAHEAIDFPRQLAESTQQARQMMKKCGVEAARHLRRYRTARTVSLIVVDDAVLYTPIRLSQSGVAARLTKCGFTVCNAGSSLGGQLLADFASVWESSAPL